MMKIGYFGFNNGPLAQREALSELLPHIEACGFESVWTGEHIVAVDPQEPPSIVAPDYPMLDTVASLSFAAGLTKRLKLGSGIILLAQRNPVVLAKELASLDVLSGGRLLFGVGVGYVKREFDVVGIPFEERGARVTEHIEAIRTLWTQDRPHFDGRFTNISGVQSKPMPLQQPHPPFIIGGTSAAAYRRAIRQGDGWYGYSMTEDMVANSIAGLKAAAEEFGGSARFNELEISVTPRGPVDIQRMKRYEEMGVSRLILLPPSKGDPSSLRDVTKRFVEDTATELKLV